MRKIEEVWKDIPGYEGLYQVSNLGRVYSIRNNMIRKLSLDKHGYQVVSLKINGKVKLSKVHRLVLYAFIGESEKQVNHLDAVRTNNKIENLEYCTGSENMRHAYKLGNKSQKGSKNTGAKLREQDVIEIKELMKKGYRNSKLARMYNVAPVTISQIRTKTNWSHIE